MQHRGEDAPIWVLADEKIGSKNQCLALASALTEALDLPYCVKDLRLRWPFSHLPPALIPARFGILDRNSTAQIKRPWPQIIIASGARLGPVSLAIKAASGGHSLAVQILDPIAKRSQFDAIITPQHDRGDGPNFIRVQAALSWFPHQRRQQAAQALAPLTQDRPTPHIAVMLGGPSGQFSYSADLTAYLTQPLEAMLKDTGGSIFVCPSRRTPSWVMSQLETWQRQQAPQRVWLWDGSGDNPYWGLLAHCEHLVVTQDSVNMIAEAAGMGRGVHVLPIPPKGAAGGKAERFLASMRAADYARLYQPPLRSWHAPCLDDTHTAVTELLRRFPRQFADLVAGRPPAPSHEGSDAV